MTQPQEHPPCQFGQGWRIRGGVISGPVNRTAVVFNDFEAGLDAVEAMLEQQCEDEDEIDDTIETIVERPANFIEHMKAAGDAMRRMFGVPAALLSMIAVLLVASVAQAARPHDVYVMAFTSPASEQYEADQECLDAIGARGISIWNINGDAWPKSAQAHKVYALPTFIVYRDGREYLRTSNARRVCFALRVPVPRE